MKLKDKWIQALRSGSYEQGQETLRTYDNKYCCLGVLADISDVGRWDRQGDSDYSYFVDEDGKVTEWDVDFGGTTSFLFNLPARKAKTLIQANDGAWNKDDREAYHPELTSAFMELRNATFEEIANWIEAHVEGD